MESKPLKYLQKPYSTLYKKAECQKLGSKQWHNGKLAGQRNLTNDKAEE